MSVFGCPETPVPPWAAAALSVCRPLWKLCCFGSLASNLIDAATGQSYLPSPDTGSRPLMAKPKPGIGRSADRNSLPQRSRSGSAASVTQRAGSSRR